MCGAFPPAVVTLVLGTMCLSAVLAGVMCQTHPCHFPVTHLRIHSDTVKCSVSLSLPQDKLQCHLKKNYVKTLSTLNEIKKYL